MSQTLLVYGAYGYTGRLVMADAQARGIDVMVAGRNAERAREVADAFGAPYRVFGLDDPAEVDAGLEGMAAVAHCAGPFSRTAVPMADGCLRNGVHYLDITGEIEVFEALAAMDARAKEAGIMVMPGTGFDVVPSDCLAAHLKRTLPSATHLVLAIASSGRPSHGTATTIVENIHRGGFVRREGRLTPVPGCYRVREIDYGGGKRMPAMAIPWGDVATAWRSTGIPNIEVYMAAPAGLRWFAWSSRFLGPVLGSGPVQRFLKGRIDAAPAGPTDEDRARGWCRLYGEVRNAQGDQCCATMKTPDGYTLTSAATVHIAQKVLSGDAPVGYQTPSTAYGADLVLELDGVART